MFQYVFGYASLVALEDADAVSGRLHGYRRCWGVAMNNWEGGEGVKHYLDPETGERPRVRVAYLDIYEREGSVVNGLALPVDAARLAELDAREVNYERVELTGAFEPALDAPVFAYAGLPEARERCRRGIEDGATFVAGDYARGVRRAFERLGPAASAEYDRSTDPCPFPERKLQAIPGRAGA